MRKRLLQRPLAGYEQVALTSMRIDKDRTTVYRISHFNYAFNFKENFIFCSFKYFEIPKCKLKVNEKIAMKFQIS